MKFFDKLSKSNSSKKKFLVLCMLFGTFSIASCSSTGGQGGNPDDPTPTPEPEPTPTPGPTPGPTPEPGIELTGINITKSPTKVDYFVGDFFDPNGMEVTALYSDKSSKEVKDYTYSPKSALTLSDTKITVSYSGFNAYQVINVENRPGPGPDPEYITLNAPTLSVNSSGEVSWTAIENAEYYRYYINNGEFETTKNTSITLQEGQSISVMADSTNEYVIASSWSDPISFVNIDETYKYATISFFNAPGMNVVTHPKGTGLSITTTPKKDQYTFDGWYKDAFFKEEFTDGEIVNDDLKLYAKWVTPTYMDANFFVKCNSKLSNNEKGYKDDSGTSWGFIPLHYDAALSASLGNRKAFSAIVTSDSSSSESSPAEYIIMDGIDDLTGRKYWKSTDDSNFTVKSAGTWKISFSIEYEWDSHGQKVHAHLESYSSKTYSLSKNDVITANDLLPTPNVTLSKESSKASWSAVEGAAKYVYSINNGEIKETNATEVNLYQGQYVVVKAIADSNAMSSKWSAPVVYNYNEPIKDDSCYVTFFNTEVPGLKINKNTVITEPGTPTKIGYTFGGWFKDVTKKTPFDFSAPITKNTNIYGKWNEVTETNRYFLMSPSGQKVVELHLNQAQSEFNEYFATFKAETSGTYKVVDSLDNNKVLYTHLIDDIPAEYQICFSFDHMYSNDKFAAVNHTRYSLYFTNNLDENNDPSAHYWIEGGKGTTWPGTKMSFEKVNKYGQKVYSLSLYKNYYDYIIFNNSNNGKQTVKISLDGVSNKTQWWCTGDKDSSGYYKVSSGTYEG